MNIPANTALARARFGDKALPLVEEYHQLNGRSSSLSEAEQLRLTQVIAAIESAGRAVDHKRKTAQLYKTVPVQTLAKISVLQAITAEAINTELSEGISEFGEYQYQDKGAREVIDIDVILARLEDLDADQISTVLLELLDIASRNQRLVSELLHGLDHRQDFDQILTDQRLGGLY